MRVVALGAAVVAATLVPGVARADWQYTRWGMTPEQVIAASKGEVGVRPIKFQQSGGPVEEVGGIYRTDDRTYDVSFNFTDSKLSLVTLKADPCGSVITDLKTTYGQPVDQSGGQFPKMVWADKRAKNRVTVFQMFSKCLIMYAPLTSKGL